MPRQIIERLLADIRADVSQHFRPDARYRTIREISELFGVSLQTAQRAVSELARQRLLVTRDRSGIYVLGQDATTLLAGKTIMVVSANADPRFNEAFLRGIVTAAGGVGMTAALFPVRGRKFESLEFGELLQQEYGRRNAAGLIALAFRNTDLPFYHLVSTGHVVISDVRSHQLPSLPSVQSDNRRHAAEAAREFARKGKTSILIAGYWPAGNTRHAAFEEAFLSTVPGGRCKYVHLADDLSTADLYLFFRSFSARDAVFAIDYAANHTVAPYFVSQHVSPVNNLIVFDCEYEGYAYTGLPAIQAAAPSLSTLGQRLAEKVIDRIRTGAWREPIHELV